MQTGVAIVDTGIYRHRDFGSRITGFVDSWEKQRL